MPSRIHYAASGLDRAAHRRRDADWLAAQLRADSLTVVPVWRDRNLARLAGEGDAEPAADVVRGADARALLDDAAEVPVFLGLSGDDPVFAVDLSVLEEGEALSLVLGADAGDGFVDLRTIGAVLPGDTAALLAYARGLLYWHRRHRFCGACGSPTEAREGGHVRCCTSAGCGVQHFPRTDPAVIMLVTAAIDGEDCCLLGRQPTWPEGLYSSLAGFVEPGETLEAAVAREVWEEARIEVADVTYRASQPWPFPSSLMLGFRARALTHDIDTEPDELDDARWFTRREIERLARGEGDERKLSRPDSIARWLIDDWLES